MSRRADTGGTAHEGASALFSRLLRAIIRASRFISHARRDTDVNEATLVAFIASPVYKLFSGGLRMIQEDIQLRSIVEADRSRIMEISSQIWDGGDWVPEEIDAWLQDKSGEAVAAVLDGRIIGFARRTWLCPGHAWFEGLRTDPAYAGRGAAREMTRHLIDSARHAGAKKIHLSTHIGNKASIHIIESYGFTRIAGFVLLERTIEDRIPSQSSAAIESVSEEAAVRFVDRSIFLELAQRRFPRGWRFFPFDVDPPTAIARLETRIGIRHNGKLMALACVRQSVDSTGSVTLNFCDGAPEVMSQLLEEIHRLYSGRTIETMIPKTEHAEAAVMAILQELGYQSWDNSDANVFVYELALS